MAGKEIKAAVSHQAREIEELRADRELAAEYFKAAIEALNDPADRTAGLAALDTTVRLITEESDNKPQNDIDRAWIALAQRRVDEIRAGTVQSCEAQQALNDARQMLRRMGTG